MRNRRSKFNGKSLLPLRGTTGCALIDMLTDALKCRIFNQSMESRTHAGPDAKVEYELQGDHTPDDAADPHRTLTGLPSLLLLTPLSSTCSPLLPLLIQACCPGTAA